jgi:hypothetical protein
MMRFFAGPNTQWSSATSVASSETHLGLIRPIHRVCLRGSAPLAFIIGVAISVTFAVADAASFLGINAVDSSFKSLAEIALAALCVSCFFSSAYERRSITVQGRSQRRDVAEWESPQL